MSIGELINQIELNSDYRFIGNTKDVDLSEYFITSKAETMPMIDDDKLFKLDDVDNIKISVKKAEGQKCSRCWKILKFACKRNNCGLKN